MEHKLILGGEVYLPFARSRIKALRATGLKYATQRFTMPGGEQVRVQISGEHEYIEIEGAITYDVVSGVVKGGTIVDIPVPADSPPGTAPKKALSSLRPTADAWEFPLKKDPKKSPTSFHDETLFGNVNPVHYSDVCASMFSGDIAGVVQLILAYTPVTELKYDYRWEKCHGAIYVAADDYRYWLVEISRENGLLVMPMPVFPNTKKGSPGYNKLVASTRPILADNTRNFFGLPSGRSFPKGDALTEAIASGRIMRLLSVEEMEPVYSKLPYSESMGWSFAPDGRAMNTCYKKTAGVSIGYLYQIDIQIGVLKDGKADASASLTEVEHGELRGASRFKFWDYTAGKYNLTPTTAENWTDTTTVEKVGVPIFVCYVAFQWDIVRHFRENSTAGYAEWNPESFPRSREITGGGYAISIDPYRFRWQENVGALHDTFISSTFREGRAGASYYRLESQIAISTTTTRPYGLSWSTDHPVFDREVLVGQRLTTVGCSLIGTRDGYAMRAPPDRENGGTGAADGEVTLTQGAYIPGNLSGATVQAGVYKEYVEGALVGLITENGIFALPPTPVISTFAKTESDYITVRSSRGLVSDIYIDYDDLGAHLVNDALWKNGLGKFILRESMLGGTQGVHSANMTTSDEVVCIGSAVEGESPSTEKFVFIGSTDD